MYTHFLRGVDQDSIAENHFHLSLYCCSAHLEEPTFVGGVLLGWIGHDDVLSLECGEPTRQRLEPRFPAATAGTRAEGDDEVVLVDPFVHGVVESLANWNDVDGRRRRLRLDSVDELCVAFGITTDDVTLEVDAEFVGDGLHGVHRLVKAGVGGDVCGQYADDAISDVPNRLVVREILGNRQRTTDYPFEDGVTLANPAAKLP